MFARRRFPSGLVLPPHKDRPFLQPLRSAPAPAVAVVALDQGSGIEAQPAVEPGERVRVGARIALAADDSAAPVHAPVAGIVRAIERRDVVSAAGAGLCITIENDGSDQPEPGASPIDWRTMAPEDLLRALRDSGIAGLGGAAFPAATKLASARRTGDVHLVLNGAECEPWICCDDALMRDRAARVVLGAQVMIRAAGATRCTIAVEDDKPEAGAAVRSAIDGAADRRIGFCSLRSVYPAGAERQLLAAVTGIEVPHDSLPTGVGLLCHNVGTATAVASFVATGAPITARIVTVTGSGVAAPANLETRLGTPIADLVAACGGYVGPPVRLVAGGPMTGRALATDAAPITQAINCVLVATAADLTARGTELPCIRCGDCADVCPPGLLPQQLHRGVAAGDAGVLERHGLGDCIECGCCDYVCPSRIPLTARFREARRAARERDVARQRASDARERYERHERRLREAAEAERSAFEAARRHARGERME